MTTWTMVGIGAAVLIGGGAAVVAAKAYKSQPTRLTDAELLLAMHRCQEMDDRLAGQIGALAPGSITRSALEKAREGNLKRWTALDMEFKARHEPEPGVAKAERENGWFLRFLDTLTRGWDKVTNLSDPWAKGIWITGRVALWGGAGWLLWQTWAVGWSACPWTYFVLGLGLLMPLYLGYAWPEVVTA